MFQIIAIALISAIVAIFLRSIDTSLSFLTIIAAGIIIIILSLDYLTDTFSLIDTLVNHSGVDNDLFIIIFKITGISYIIEFSAELLDDFGMKSLSSKVVFAGKLIIISLASPIIYSVFNLMVDILK